MQSLSMSDFGKATAGHGSRLPAIAKPQGNVIARQREATAAYLRMFPRHGSDLRGQPEKYRHNESKALCTVTRFQGYGKVDNDGVQNGTKAVSQGMGTTYTTNDVVEVTPHDCFVKPTYTAGFFLPFAVLGMLYTKEEAKAE